MLLSTCKNLVYELFCFDKKNVVVNATEGENYVMNMNQLSGTCSPVGYRFIVNIFLSGYFTL